MTNHIETNLMSVSVISPKGLEKQLKVVEERIESLKSELVALDKIQWACRALLGQSEQQTPSDKSAKKDRKKKATEVDAGSHEEAESIDLNPEPLSDSIDESPTLLA